MTLLRGDNPLVTMYSDDASKIRRVLYLHNVSTLCKITIINIVIMKYNSPINLQKNQNY